MAASKSASKDDKGFAPAQRGNLAPPFTKKAAGKKPRRAFTPASRSMSGGGR